MDYFALISQDIKLFFQDQYGSLLVWAGSIIAFAIIIILPFPKESAKNIIVIMTYTFTLLMNGFILFLFPLTVTGNDLEFTVGLRIFFWLIVLSILKVYFSTINLSKFNEVFLNVKEDKRTGEQ